jgi:prophage regulatory protein
LRDVAPSEKRHAQNGPILILRLPQVLDVTALGKTKVYELQSRGSFPMQVQITDHSVGWIEEEVQARLAKRIAISASR